MPSDAVNAAPTTASRRSPFAPRRNGTSGHPSNAARVSPLRSASRRHNNASVDSVGWPSRVNAAPSSASSGRHGTGATRGSVPFFSSASPHRHTLGKMRGMSAASASPSSGVTFNARVFASASSRDDSVASASRSTVTSFARDSNGASSAVGTYNGGAPMPPG